LTRSTDKEEFARYEFSATFKQEAAMKLFMTGIRRMLAIACLCAFSQQADARMSAVKSARPEPDIKLAPADMDWAQAPEFLPQGAEISLLEGSLTQSGPYTIRLRLPPGYYLPPHRHAAAERVTVISGVLMLGSGTAPDKQKTKPLEAGSFAFMSANKYHYAFAEGVTVLQLHGRGPWQIMYADPADDPGKKKDG